MYYFNQRFAAILFLITIVTLSTNCRKESSSDNGCKTDMQHIAGNYKLSGLKYKANASGAEQDFLDQLDDCEKDDLIVLHANGSYEHKDVGLICSPENSMSGTWGIQGNHITSSDAGFLEGTITNFDCKLLVYYVSDIYTTGDKLTFTLTKQ
jgi:Lipocalin-like domain